MEIILKIFTPPEIYRSKKELLPPQACGHAYAVSQASKGGHNHLTVLSGRDCLIVQTLREITVISDTASPPEITADITLPAMRALSLPLCGEAIAAFNNLTGSPGSLALVAIGPEASPHLDSAVGELHAKGLPVYALASAAVPAIRERCLSLGIADILAGDAVSDISEYYAACNPPSPRKGGILIVDDDPARVRILTSIIARFGYAATAVESMEAMFEQAAVPGFHLNLMNIGTKKFSIEAFVKRAYSSAEIKKIPIIAYKCMKDGLFVHEITAGLNRYTKVILSPEELYGLLVNLLFRSELAPQMKSLNSAVKTEELLPLAALPPGQIYFTLGTGLCSDPYIFMGDTVGAVRSMTEKLRESLLRIEGIRWLVRDVKPGPTCGAGV